jgi:hypothetical protein
MPIKIKILTIQESKNNQGGKVKILFPARIEAIEATNNPNVLSVKLSCEVYTFYEGYNRNDYGWTLQKEHLRSIGIPEPYVNWITYEPEVRYATDNISKFIARRLDLEEGMYIDGTFIDKLKLKDPPFDGCPQVIYFKVDDQIYHTVNRTGIKIRNEEELVEVQDIDFDPDDIIITEMYYPRFVLNTLNEVRDDDEKRSVSKEEVWVCLEK